MRIVSGKYGGRKIEVPKGDSIRPTSDKVRGAIFNILVSRKAVIDSIVLDAFCGTGALGLEALSRGAAFCTFMDVNQSSIEVARQNIKNLGAGDTSHIDQRNALKPGLKPEELMSANLVMLDPPYNKDLLSPALEALLHGQWFSRDALIVCEAEKTYRAGFPSELTVDDERVYKDTKVFFLTFNQRS